MTVEKLLKELEEERKNIKTDNYSMSIGEIINLYKEGDLKLDPAFQRLFRWSDEQKTKFIESVLLGIPIPEIFVAQKTDGKWTVVDGVQRISTVLQLVGDLNNKEALVMTWAKYLPSLEGQTWETLPQDVKRLFRRGKFGINIILTENSVEAQYELFQRLNTGGLHLEDQEIRNCLIIMLDSDFYDKINNLKTHETFKNSLQISDRKHEEEYPMELILRYFIATAGLVDYKDYSITNDHIREFIDKETIRLIKREEFVLSEHIEHFKKVFDWLYDMLGESAFKRYNESRERFEGQFSNASFEAITTGVALNFERVSNHSREEFKTIIIELYQTQEFQENVRHGIKPIVRFKALTELSARFFSEK